MRVIMDENGNKYLSCMLKEVESIKDIPLFVQLALSLFSLERSYCMLSDRCTLSIPSHLKDGSHSFLNLCFLVLHTKHLSSRILCALIFNLGIYSKLSLKLRKKILELMQDVLHKIQCTKREWKSNLMLQYFEVLKKEKTNYILRLHPS